MSRLHLETMSVQNVVTPIEESYVAEEIMEKVPHWHWTPSPAREKGKLTSNLPFITVTMRKKMRGVT